MSHSTMKINKKEAVKILEIGFFETTFSLNKSEGIKTNKYLKYYIITISPSAIPDVESYIVPLTTFLPLKLLEFSNGPIMSAMQPDRLFSLRQCSLIHFVFVIDII